MSMNQTPQQKEEAKLDHLVLSVIASNSGIERKTLEVRVVSNEIHSVMALANIGFDVALQNALGRLTAFKRICHQAGRYNLQAI